jgi:hypothetical protein
VITIIQSDINEKTLSLGKNGESENDYLHFLFKMITPATPSSTVALEL